MVDRPGKYTDNKEKKKYMLALINITTFHSLACLATTMLFLIELRVCVPFNNLLKKDTDLMHGSQPSQK